MLTPNLTNHSRRFRSISNWLQTPVRISSILFAILFASLGNSILVVIVPINLQDLGVSISIIGWIMAGYSLGILLGSNYGHRIISRVGHNRSYASVAALISCVAVIHVFTSNQMVMVFLRLLVGVSMAVIYITLESWLNATSEKDSRGSTYALYQIFFAIGVFCSPFVITLIDPLDSKSFAIVALFLSFSLIPLSLSRFPTPELLKSQKRLSIMEMLRDTPSGSVTSIISGLVMSALYIFCSIYGIWLGFDQTQTALLIATATGSAIVFQFPIGKLADRFDERRIVMAISLLATITAVITYLMSHLDIDWRYYLVAVFFMGGLISCLYPLAVNFIFSQIESSKAVPAMSSLLILNSFGLILGPILCSLMMSYLDASALFIYLGALMAISTIFISYRVYVSRYKENDQESIPYAITFQMLRPTSFSLDPRVDYLMTKVSNPIIETLANGIAISPKKAQQLIEKNLPILTNYQPEEILLSLVMYKPRRAKEIITAMNHLYPNMAVSFTTALSDLIATNRVMINQLLKSALKKGQNERTQKEIDTLFQQFTIGEKKANIQI